MATTTIGFNIKILGTPQQVKELGKVESALKQLSTQRKNLNKRVKESRAFLETYNQDLRREAELYKSGAISKREYTNVTDKLKKIAQESRSVLKGEAQELGTINTQMLQLRERRRVLNKEIREQTRLNTANIGSLNQMKAELSKLTIEYNGLSEEKRENSQRGKELQTRIRQLNDELKEEEAILGKTGRNVGNYKEAVRGLESRLTKLINEQNRLKKSGKDSGREFRAIQREIDRTEKEYKQLNVQMNQYNKTINSVFVQNNNVIGSFRNLGAALGVTAGLYGLAEAGRFVVSTFADFESTMSKVQAITGATGENFDRLQQTARELGETTQFSATESAEAMVFLGQAGFNTAQILEALPATLDLAASGSIGLAEAADISSNILSGFRLSASEAERVIDVMAKTVTTSNTNIEQLGQAMKFISPVAATLGITVEETSAAIGALGNAGLQGQVATTALATSLGRLADPPRKAAAAMKRLNIELFENGEFKGLASTVEELEVAFEGLTDQQKVAATQQIFGAEATKQISSLLGFQYTTMKDGEEVVLEGSKALKIYTEELEGASGAAKEMSEIMIDNLEGDTLKARSAVQELAISLGESLRPILRGVVQGFTELIKWINENSSTLVRLGKIIGTATGLYVAYRGIILATALASSGLRAASLALSAAQAVVVGNTGKATAAFRLFNSTLKTTPVGILVTALATLGGILLTSSANAQDLNQELGETAKVSKAVSDFTGEINDKMTTEAAKIKTVFDRLKETNPKSRERKELIDKINGTYGTTLKNLSDEQQFIKQLDLEYNKLLDTLKRRIILQTQEEKISELIKEQLEVERLVNQYKEAAKTQEAYRTEIVKTTKAGVGLTQEQLDQLDSAADLTDNYQEQILKQKQLSGLEKVRAKDNEKNLARLKQIESTIKGILNESNKQLEALDAVEGGATNVAQTTQTTSSGGGSSSSGNFRKRRIDLIKQLNEEILQLTEELRDAEVNNLQQSLSKEIALIERANEKKVASYRSALSEELEVIKQGQADKLLTAEQAAEKRKVISDLYGRLISESEKNAADKTTEVLKNATALQLSIFSQQLEERGNLSEAERNLVSEIQERITEKVKEEAQGQTQIKLNELDRQAKKEKQIAAAIIDDAQKLSQRKKEIDLETAKAKFELLKAELSLTENVTEQQVEQLRRLYQTIKQLSTPEEDEGDEQLTGLAKFLNISNDEAEFLQERAVNIGRSIYGTLVEMRQQAIQQQLDRELESVQKQRDKELKILEESRKKGLISEEQFAKAKSKIDKEAQAEKYQLEKEAFERSKKRQRAEAALAGAMAIMRIAADVPKADFGVTTGILIAAQAIQTGLQIAKIDAQEFGQGGEVKGGKTKGKSHKQGGEFGVLPDGSLINFEGGEFFVNSRAIASVQKLSVTGTPLEIAQAVNDFGNGIMNPKAIKTFGLGGRVPTPSSFNFTPPTTGQEVDFGNFAEKIVNGINSKSVEVVETDITETQETIEVIETSSTF